MVFKCQEDSFLKEFSSIVTSCEKVKDSIFYEVILEDTILFPEGGGQPSDHGYLNNIPVKQVVRRGDQAVHFTELPLNVGQTVQQIVNWERRFDHMQQHSGQHLISAVIENKFEISTVSWWLGEEISYVELDTPVLSNDQIGEIECIVNDLIRQKKDVSVTVFSKDSPEEELNKTRSVRGLPKDHVGDVRVINIADIDSNMCCGTHVSNLSQLQVIKLLNSEKSKRKNQILLNFLVGNRINKRLSLSLEREQRLTTLLKTNPVQHAEFVEKLQRNVKTLNKHIQLVLKDLAILEAQKLNSSISAIKYFFLYRKEADVDFMNTFIKEVGPADILLFLSTGDEKTLGNIVLYGNEKAVQELGPKICEIMEGKGATKGNRFQAKVMKMINRKQAEQLIINFFN